MKENKFDFIELIKGLLVVLSYFMLGYLLSALFSVLIYEGILPNKHYIRVILNFSIYLILAIFQIFQIEIYSMIYNPEKEN